MRFAEIRNTESELRAFQVRLGAAGIAVLVAFALLLARFVWLQVLEHDAYSAKAEENRIAIVPLPPNRGLILDRNGEVLARNYLAYTLEIFPAQVRDLDATIAQLAQFVDIQPRDRARFRKLLQETKNVDSLPIRTRLSDEEVARIAANRWRFTGVDIKARLFRKYPYGELASHVIGYMGRVTTGDLDQLEQEQAAANYRGTEYIGKAGIEASYEQELHGVTGFERVEIDAGGHGVGTLPPRTPPQAGDNVSLTLDIRLQQIAERAFGEWRGALVAIEPATGGVLAFVSKPG